VGHPHRNGDPQYVLGDGSFRQNCCATHRVDCSGWLNRKVLGTPSKQIAGFARLEDVFTDLSVTLEGETPLIVIEDGVEI
jgi:hypothetical protein